MIDIFKGHRWLQDCQPENAWACLGGGDGGDGGGAEGEDAYAAGVDAGMSAADAIGGFGGFSGPGSMGMDSQGMGGTYSGNLGAEADSAIGWGDPAGETGFTGMGVFGAPSDYDAYNSMVGAPGFGYTEAPDMDFSHDPNTFGPTSHAPTGIGNFGINSGHDFSVTGIDAANSTQGTFGPSVGNFGFSDFSHSPGTNFASPTSAPGAPGGGGPGGGGAPSGNDFSAPSSAPTSAPPGITSAAYDMSFDAQNGGLQPDFAGGGFQGFVPGQGTPPVTAGDVWSDQQGQMNPYANYLARGYSSRGFSPQYIASTYSDVGLSPNQVNQQMMDRGLVQQPMPQGGWPQMPQQQPQQLGLDQQQFNGVQPISPNMIPPQGGQGQQYDPMAARQQVMLAAMLRGR